MSSSKHSSESKGPPRGRGMRPAAFEEFKHELRQHPREEVSALLDKKMHSAVQDLFGEPSAMRRTEAIRNFIFISMAKSLHEGEDKVVGPFDMPYWIKQSRTAITSYIEEDAEHRAHLYDTAFFQHKPHLFRRLTGWVEASMELDGSYDDQARTVGTALGKLALRPLTPEQ